MADSTSVQSRIVASVFSRRNAAGNLAETYVSHIKIWEDAEGGSRKPRYILLSQTATGTGYIHKSKLNTNGTFSVGKTWNLPELRGLQALGPLEFNITLSRTYRWTTENDVDQVKFVEALIKLFRSVTGNAPLRIEGFSDPAPAPAANTTSPPSTLPNDTSRSRTQSHVSTADRESVASSARQGRSAPPARTASPVTPLASRPPPENNQARSANSYGNSLPRSQSPALSQQASSSWLSSSNPPADNPVPSLPSQYPEPSSSINGSRTRKDSRREAAESFKNASRSRGPSPAPSSRSQRPTNQHLQPPAQSRRDPNARVSFFDPGNQAVLDRLIVISAGDEEGDDETAQASMTNVEEMLEGYDWASDDIISKKSGSGAADLIEARLTDELMALEKANIHSFLESDDRVTVVLKYIDDALAQLDSMETLVSSYKIHLNAAGDDISFIQSQNRGLQVQTQNQKALLAELETVLQTVHVDRDALLILSQERTLEKASSITKLEEAATTLYKALQAGRDTDMAATMERLEEYKTHNYQFCKRLFDYMSITFTAQSSELLRKDPDGLRKGPQSRPTLVPHQDIEDYLGRYSGLILYIKEMDEGLYAKLCATYFSASSELHRKQISALLAFYLSSVKRAPDDDAELGLNPNMAKAPSGMRRAGTIIRSPMERKEKEKRTADGDMPVSEAFSLILEQLAPHLHKEDEFIQDLLQINDAALTFADYMGLENYFRRQAASSAVLSQSTIKLVRGAMELIFGFLPAELKVWLDASLEKDSIQIIGVLSVLERFLIEAEERGNAFLYSLLEKQHLRLKGSFERHISQQIKKVEQTKVTSKKRGGVAPFIRTFPLYVDRVESQLIGSDSLEIRSSVDLAYDKIVQTMFDSLKHMAKLEGEGEDKGQLNYHVVLIENMHHFVAEIGRQEIGSARSFLKKAEAIYDESLNAYVKIVLRRPFSKLIDYFEGVERQLKTTAPTEISNNSNFSKSSLKKVIKEYNSKDVRKHIEVLYKRVEKHFTEASEKTTNEDRGAMVAGTVLIGVWKACETELLRITEFFGKRITQCYPDSGVSLEYTPSDIDSAFRRQIAN